MKNLLKGTAASFLAVTTLSLTAFAATVPVRATLEKEGYTISWDAENKAVIIEKDSFKMTEPVGDNITLDFDTTYTTEEFINSVNENYNKELYSTTAAITETGSGYILAETEKLGEVMFLTDENTFIHREGDNEAAVPVKGDIAKIYFDEAMTLSLPPQIHAGEVVISSAKTKSGTVSEVTDEYITVVCDKDEVYRFNVDENTFFHHAVNRRLYRIDDIQPGMEVKVIHSEAMTFSIPPQSYASEVIITDSDDTQEQLSMTGTVQESASDYFTIQTQQGDIVRFNADENTFFHHAVNRRLYRIDDIQPGMEVEVIHEEEMTASVPPQCYAKEVIIK